MNRCDINVNHRFPTITKKKILKTLKEPMLLLLLRKKKSEKTTEKHERDGHA